MPGQDAFQCRSLPAKELRFRLRYITCEQTSSEPRAALGQGSLLAAVRKKRVDGFQVALRSPRGVFCILTSKEKHLRLHWNSSRVVSSKPSNVLMPAGNQGTSVDAELLQNVSLVALPLVAWHAKMQCCLIFTRLGMSDLGRGSGSCGRKPAQPQGE